MTENCGEILICTSKLPGLFDPVSMKFVFMESNSLVSISPIKITGTSCK